MKRPGPMLLATALLAVASIAGRAPADPGGDVHAHAKLVPPGPPAPPSPSGKMDVELRAADAHHAAGSHFRISVSATADTAYTMWADDPGTADPALVQFASFTTGHDGRAALDYDSHDGDPMPFGASLADLGGKPIEMRDAANATILAGTIPVAAGKNRPATLHGQSDLARPVGSPFPDSVGRIRAEVHEADASHAAWSRLRIELSGLGARAQYALWADDPSTPAADLVQFGVVTTDRHGRARFVRDTRRGDALPFGASLADLGGKAIEIRDGAGVVALSGQFPVPQGPPEPKSGPPLHGHGDLLPPGGPLPPPPSGTIDEDVHAADAHHAARSHARISVEHLAADATFTLWADDPSTADSAPTQFGSLTTDAHGRGALDLDTHDGDPMPFGASLADLGGKSVEVRDGAGAAVLVGAFPTLVGPSQPPAPTLHGKADLTRPTDSPLPTSVGRLDEEVHPATPGRAEFSRLTIEVRGLAASTPYLLLADDPATPDTATSLFATVTTDAKGRARVTIDTNKGGALPFGASLADLAGHVVEVRDANDVLVLAGTFPTPR